MRYQPERLINTGFGVFYYLEVVFSQVIIAGGVVGLSRMPAVGNGWQRVAMWGSTGGDGWQREALTGVDALSAIARQKSYGYRPRQLSAGGWHKWRWLAR